MNKRLLLIRACALESETPECDVIKALCSLAFIDVVEIKPTSNEELESMLSGHSSAFDYIYLSAHGNESSFSDEVMPEDCKITMDWLEFGSLLCESGVLADECNIFLSCCRGGLNQVAYTFFWSCPSVQYIIGPRQSLTSLDMVTAFATLLYNIEGRGTDAVIACKKVEAGTDLRFMCFDRLEVVREPAYLQFIKDYEVQFCQQIQARNEEKERQRVALRSMRNPMLGKIISIEKENLE